jgi:hypothetical protein
VLSSRLTVATLVGGLVAASVVTPLFVSPASAANYTATGTVQRSATGVSVTDTEFRQSTCPNAPSTQGLDAYVFALPAAYATSGTTISLTAPSGSPHDFSASVYNGDCSFDRTAANASMFDLTFTLGAGDTYLAVYSSSGSNITISLTAIPVTTPSYTAPGSLQHSVAGNVSATDQQWRHTCPATPQTQGLDAFVFALPAAYAVAGTTISLTAPSTSPHDFSASVYNGDCSFDRTAANASTFDLTFTLGAGDTYVVAYSSSGANIAVTLTATPPSTSTYSAPGSITRQATTGIGVTDTEFSLTCPDAPTTQGVDGWVFTLPAGSGGLTATLTSTPRTATHDFTAYVYNADCSFDRTVDDTSSTDLAFLLDSNDGFASVITTTGANVNVTLTVG